MKIPDVLTLENAGYELDGGSIILNMEDETAVGHVLYLKQRMFLDSFDDGIPGRLYFDHKPVDVRSAEEFVLIDILKKVLEEYKEKHVAGPKKEIPDNTLILSQDLVEVFTNSAEENTLSWLSEIINFVSSDEYIVLSRKMDKQMSA